MRFLAGAETLPILERQRVFLHTGNDLRAIDQRHRLSAIHVFTRHIQKQFVDTTVDPGADRADAGLRFSNPAGRDDFSSNRLAFHLHGLDANRSLFFLCELNR